MFDKIKTAQEQLLNIDRFRVVNAMSGEIEQVSDDYLNSSAFCNDTGGDILTGLIQVKVSKHLRKIKNAVYGVIYLMSDTGCQLSDRS